MKYNTAFFSLYENIYLVLSDNFGEKKALFILSKVFEKGLKKSYDSLGFTNGKPEDFKRVVSKRDKSVGLIVKISVVSSDKIIYRFYTDPFPSLKGFVEPEKLDLTYLNFKVMYLLGNTWSYTTTKHIWRGDKYTEHAISNKGS